MENLTRILFLEVNYSGFTFFVGENDERNNFKLIFKLDVPIAGNENDRISDFEKIFRIFKKNIFLIEQKLNYIFKEVVLILENSDPTFINLCGYKKLNGSQILRENITYILNTLKSNIDKLESKKTILHIFNSNFFLDNKNIDTVPIGLFGDFYSQELSFVLIDINYNKNLKDIIANSNLKIKKILLKSFIEGVNIIDNNNLNTFFKVKIFKERSKVFYFQNNSLKFQQDFKFGFEIIINDISKITSLKKETVVKILEKIEFSDEISDEELVDKNLFEKENYIKIKKKLIYEIIFTRVKEISEIMILKNINLTHQIRDTSKIFIELNTNLELNSLKKIYKSIFSNNSSFDVNCIDHFFDETLLSTAIKLVQYGWKNEAIPVTTTQKSLIARFFNRIFE